MGLKEIHSWSCLYCRQKEKKKQQKDASICFLISNLPCCSYLIWIYFAFSLEANDIPYKFSFCAILGPNHNKDKRASGWPNAHKHQHEHSETKHGQFRFGPFGGKSFSRCESCTFAEKMTNTPKFVLSLCQYFAAMLMVWPFATILRSVSTILAHFRFVPWCIHHQCALTHFLPKLHVHHTHLNPTMH